MGNKKEVPEGAKVSLFITLQDMPGLLEPGGGGRGPTDFWRSVNSIQTGGRLGPPHSGLTPPGLSDLPTTLHATIFPN